MTEDEKTVPKRDQVLELLKEGGYTREEMATKLNMSVASVNSQFTYLRWMKNFIKYDENKKLSLCTEEEYNEWEASKKATAKKSTAKVKTPAEAYVAMKKVLDTDTKNRDAWITKFEAAKAAVAADPNNEDLVDANAEASAMVILLSLKVKRAQAKFDATPVPEPEAPVEEIVSTDEIIEAGTDPLDDDEATGNSDDDII